MSRALSTFLNVVQVLLVLLGTDDGLHVAAVGGHDLLLETTDREHLAPKVDLSGHRHVLAHRHVE
jgi:hypothetical protein